MNDSALFIPVLAIIGFFATVIILIYSFFRTRHRERMELIKSGNDSSIFKSHYDQNSALKYGLLMIGIGLGLFLGYLVYEYTALDFPPIVLVFALIFGGISLLGFYFIINRQENSDQ